MTETLPLALRMEMETTERVVRVTSRVVAGVSFTRYVVEDEQWEETRAIYVTEDGFVLSPVSDSSIRWSWSQWVPAPEDSPYRALVGPLEQRHRQSMREQGYTSASIGLNGYRTLERAATAIANLREDARSGLLPDLPEENR